MSIEAKIQEFSAIAANPAAQLKKFKDEGKKVVGVLPYYAPEELVYAAGMVPMGIWGSNDKTIVRSKEYFLLHHRSAGSGNAAGRHHGSAGCSDHSHHLRYSAPHEPELPRCRGQQDPLHLPGSSPEPLRRLGR